MGKLVASVLYAATMVVAVVRVDLLFFKHHSGQWLAANVGIVLVFVTSYWRFFKCT